MWADGTWGAESPPFYGINSAKNAPIVRHSCQSRPNHHGLHQPVHRSRYETVKQCVLRDERDECRRNTTNSAAIPCHGAVIAAYPAAVCGIGPVLCCWPRSLSLYLVAALWPATVFCGNMRKFILHSCSVKLQRWGATLLGCPHGLSRSSARARPRISWHPHKTSAYCPCRTRGSQSQNSPSPARVWTR